MRVVVKIFTGLRKFLPTSAGEHEMSVPRDTSVKGVLDLLGIPDEVPKMILVNRRHAAPGRVLSEGDVISVVRPIAGG